jgi:hypothetical protein
VTIEPVAIGGDVSNGGMTAIEVDAPYVARVTVTGTTKILWHRWQTDEVEARAKAAKGSVAKNTDNLEASVWRDEDGVICLPGEYLRGSLTDRRNGAAKYRQDPRSPRKSALDLYKASIIPMTELAPITLADGSPAHRWDHVDRRRVVITGAVTRERPALSAGWSATVDLMCQSPTYIPPLALAACLNDAGRLVGIGDFRPTFGRFVITTFEILDPLGEMK